MDRQNSVWYKLKVFKTRSPLSPSMQSPDQKTRMIALSPKQPDRNPNLRSCSKLNASARRCIAARKAAIRCERSEIGRVYDRVAGRSCRMPLFEKRLETAKKLPLASIGQCPLRWLGLSISELPISHSRQNWLPIVRYAIGLRCPPNAYRLIRSGLDCGVGQASLLQPVYDQLSLFR
ncbi:hypothetical protein RUM4293_04479 [Ruegeria atlantica]|uniref:Uncharacterized protein n=1 Tax=Ruegeria atlantica TaxID=81569 RepID=A0A0P1E8V1_9RHOB|nr:hypothetical protein RUM4293_04479 [Ruegeria atlantica]